MQFFKILKISTFSAASFNHITEQDSSKYILFDGKKSYILNDGGSSLEQYYEIDLTSNIIEKKENYVCKDTHGKFGNGLLNLYMQIKESYIGKVLDKKTIDQGQCEKLKDLLQEIINKNEPINFGNYFNSYKLRFSDKSVGVAEEDFNKFISLIE